MSKKMGRDGAEWGEQLLLGKHTIFLGFNAWNCWNTKTNNSSSSYESAKSLCWLTVYSLSTPHLTSPYPNPSQGTNERTTYSLIIEWRAWNFF